MVLILSLGGCQSNTKKNEAISTTKSSQQSQFTEQQSNDYKNALQLLKNKNYPAAESSLLDLTTKAPKIAGPWANLGLIKLLQKDPANAEIFVKKALKFSPKMPQALNLMGLISTHNRDIKGAESYYLQALTSKKDYSNAHYNLALLYDIYLQDIKKAVVQYRHYLRLTNNEDKNTIRWVKQLENALKHK